MISIIVPFYCTNKEYFDRCMNSLLADKDAEIEVLLVDDGSPIQYQENIEIYSDDKRVRIFHENHKGVSNARNVGIREAVGEWLMFVDSDDFLEPEYEKELRKAMNHSDADVIIFNGYGDRYGRAIKNKYFIKENQDYGISIEEKCKVIGSGLSLGRTPEYYRCYYTLGAPYSKLIRTEYIRRKGIEFDKTVKFAEDTLFSMNLLYNADHIYYKDLYIYRYFMNEESVTGKYREGLSDDMNLFFQEAWRFISDNGLSKYLGESYNIRAFLEVQRCLRQEFCHKSNTNQDRRNQAKNFIKQEPYYTGICSKNSYMERIESRVAAFLLKHGMISTYSLIYAGLIKIRKMKPS